MAVIPKINRDSPSLLSRLAQTISLYIEVMKPRILFMLGFISLGACLIQEG